MNIIINNSSLQPIYEQIIQQVRAGIVSGQLEEHALLPSVRGLAKDLKISALTVKKAYDSLEEDGFIITVHGKGSFVAPASQELMLEERKREVEADLEAAVHKGRICGLKDEEIKELFELIMEEQG